MYTDMLFLLTILLAAAALFAGTRWDRLATLLGRGAVLLGCLFLAFLGLVIFLAFGSGGRS